MATGNGGRRASATAAGSLQRLPALLVGIAYAFSDEIHQHFVEGRHPALLDVVLDSVGVAIGIYLLRFWQTRPLPGTRQVQ